MHQTVIFFKGTPLPPRSLRHSRRHCTHICRLATTFGPRCRTGRHAAHSLARRLQQTELMGAKGRKQEMVFLRVKKTKGEVARLLFFNVLEAFPKITSTISNKLKRYYQSLTYNCALFPKIFRIFKVFVNGLWQFVVEYPYEILQKMITRKFN